MKRAVVVLLVLFLCAGCFQIEQSIKLNEDLSGEAGFTMGINLEPVALIMLQMQRSMEGKEGPPTDEEIAKAKAEMLEKMESDPGGDVTKERGELEESLPEGIKLLDFDVKQKELSITTMLRFAFDHVDRLAKLKLPEQQGGAESMMVDEPFAGLNVVDEGDTILITSKPANPTTKVEEKASESAPPDPDMERMMKEAFKDLRVAWVIDAPFEVIEDNATRREGTKLIWEYDMNSLEKMDADKTDNLEVRVRYRKK